MPGVSKGLLTYTTEVPAEQSAAEMMALLAAHGARRISYEYDGQGNVVGLSFTVHAGAAELEFRVPVDHQAVYRVLQRQADLHQVPGKYAKPDQARRVAWRVALRWVESQMAILEVGMVRLEQVMLPYLVVDPPTGKTLYEAMAERYFALPPPREE